MEADKVLYVTREDLVRGAYHLPVKKISVCHLRVEPHVQALNASIVIFKDKGQEIILKNRYGPIKK